MPGFYLYAFLPVVGNPLPVNCWKWRSSGSFTADVQSALLPSSQPCIRPEKPDSRSVSEKDRSLDNHIVAAAKHDQGSSPVCPPTRRWQRLSFEPFIRGPAKHDHDIVLGHYIWNDSRAVRPRDLTSPRPHHSYANGCKACHSYGKNHDTEHCKAPLFLHYERPLPMPGQCSSLASPHRTPTGSTCSAGVPLGPVLIASANQRAAFSGSLFSGAGGLAGVVVFGGMVTTSR